MFRNTGWLVLGANGAICAPLAAQDALLGEIYGNGVHAFNAGDYAKANQDLSAAISAGSKDPRREYYYRGLVLARMGKTGEADADFKKGVATSNVRHRQFLPGEQVDGAHPRRDRLALEQYRTAARMATFQRQQKERDMRYQGAKAGRTGDDSRHPGNIEAARSHHRGRSSGRCLRRPS